MKRIVYNKTYSWLMVFGWCSIIFYLSSLPNLKTELGVYDLILRKICHVIEYAILFLLSRSALKNTYNEWSLVRICVSAIVFSVIYAFSDEYHQSFVPGRGSSLVDVSIDSLGVAAGFLSYIIVAAKSYEK